MRQPFATLLTCQHYELLAWACQAESQARHIAEAAWSIQQHRQTSAWWAPTDAAAPHTRMRSCLALAFEAAYDQTVTQRISRMAHTVQAACAGTWHWNPGYVCLPWHQLPAGLRCSIDILDSAQSPAQWQAVRTDAVHTLLPSRWNTCNAASWITSRRWRNCGRHQPRARQAARLAPIPAPLGKTACPRTGPGCPSSPPASPAAPAPAAPARRATGRG